MLCDKFVQMTVNIRWIIAFCSLALMTLACTGTKKASLGQQEDFQSFYQRFHSDSLFQADRLRLPIQGYKIEGQSIKRWSQANWLMHKNGKGQIDENIYDIKQTILNNRVYEQITIPNSTFLMERHFENEKGKWMLTYCLEIFI